MNIKIADNYPDLFRQAVAMRQLISAKEEQELEWARVFEGIKRHVSRHSQEEWDNLHKLVEVLTNRVEELENKLDNPDNIYR